MKYLAAVALILNTTISVADVFSDSVNKYARETYSTNAEVMETKLSPDRLHAATMFIIIDDGSNSGSQFVMRSEYINGHYVPVSHTLFGSGYNFYIDMVDVTNTATILTGKLSVVGDAHCCPSNPIKIAIKHTTQ